MTTPAADRQTALVAATAALSWLGVFLHNRAELPQLTIFSPENSLTALVALLLVLAWWRLPYRRLLAILFLALGLLHLVGGAVISVLPLEFLPFSPAQTLGHYAAHLVYGLAQLPLISLMIAHLGRGA